MKFEASRGFIGKTQRHSMRDLISPSCPKRVDLPDEGPHSLSSFLSEFLAQPHLYSCFRVYCHPVHGCTRGVYRPHSRLQVQVIGASEDFSRRRRMLLAS